MLEYDGISELIKAAPKRLADGRELLQKPSRNANHSGAETRHLVGAVYIAGYAVEAILKAYVIAQTDALTAHKGLRIQRWSDLLRYRKQIGASPDLEGRRSHNLQLLLQAADLDPDLSTDTTVSAAVAQCIKVWKPALRYCPRATFDRDRAQNTLDAIETTYNWVRIRIISG